MTRGLINIAFLLVATYLLAGCVESEFHLAEESRLPVWFEVPKGMERNDLDVVLTYYTTGPAKLTLREAQGGKVLRTIKAENKWHPEYWEWAQRDWPKRSRPGYIILSAEGRKEVIEHREREPIFYVSNEAAVQNTVGSEATHNNAPQPTQ